MTNTKNKRTIELFSSKLKPDVSMRNIGAPSSNVEVHAQFFSFCSAWLDNRPEWPNKVKIGCVRPPPSLPVCAKIRWQRRIHIWRLFFILFLLYDLFIALGGAPRVFFRQRLKSVRRFGLMLMRPSQFFGRNEKNILIRLSFIDRLL